MRAFIGPAAVGLVLSSNQVLATEPLPVIVTYEMQRQDEALDAQRRDPKEFWIRQIVARLEDQKRSAAIGLKQPATAKVFFVVARDGTVLSKSIQSSSGVAAVDREALALVERAQPLPPMPAAMGEANLSFTLPLRFR